jgi:spoIIIJ-associated protein
VSTDEQQVQPDDTLASATSEGDATQPATTDQVDAGADPEAWAGPEPVKVEPADEQTNDEASAEQGDGSEDDAAGEVALDQDAAGQDAADGDAAGGADEDTAGEAGDVGEDSAGDADEDSAGEAVDEDEDSAGDAEGRGRSRRGGAARLEREGEIAADFLERLLDIADLDGDLDVDVEGERASVAIVDSPEGRVPRRLVGQSGEVLEALQELTRLAVQARTGDRSRLMLDVAGHRARRREQLVVRAQEAIGQVRDSGEPLRLEAMNPFERKIVHDAVAAAGLSSSSEGVEPDRRIVVRPAD